MKAAEMRLGPLLEGAKRYVVPYFQRAYSWRRQQWDTLFQDILELYQLRPSSSHFLGSMVLMAETLDTPSPTAEPGSVATLVIDGQQRIVTLSLLLAALRDAAREAHPGLSEHIQCAYLVSHAQGGPVQVKILTTQQDRPAFEMLVAHRQEPPPSPIRDAYRTFRQALGQQLGQGIKLEPLLGVVVAQLSFVTITLDPEDNPYRIFESLNARGMPLTQSDLLRNYFFMRLPPSEHERWYTSVWSPMQARLQERFDEYMRDFLLKDGHAIRREEVYQEWRKLLGPLDDNGVRSILRELADWSLEYDQILHPDREADARVRQQLQRLAAWSTTVPYRLNPFLLRLHADYTHHAMSAEQLAHVCVATESMLVRRLFTSAPARDEGQVLVELYEAVQSASDRAAAFADALSRPALGWPDDADFTEGVVRYPLYFASHPDQRKLVMQALEDSYPHATPVQYDHLEPGLITPLLPRSDWLAELGLSEAEYWKSIGTLGNFTWLLRGRAPDLGLAERKRELVRLTRQGLGLVSDFAAIERWSAEAIVNRSRRLASRAIQVWPGPRR